MSTDTALQLGGFHLARKHLIFIIAGLYVIINIGAAYGLREYVRSNYRLQIVNQVETMVTMVESLSNNVSSRLLEPAQRRDGEGRELTDVRRGRAASASAASADILQRVADVKQLSETAGVSLLRSMIRDARFRYFAGSESRPGYFFLYNFTDGINLAHGSDRGLEFTVVKTGRNVRAIELLEAAAGKGGGCEIYRWFAPDLNEDSLKLACVRRVETKLLDDRLGGVYVGTGMFLHEIDQNFYPLLYRMLMLMTGGFLILVTGFLLLYQRPVERLLLQILDAVSMGVLITRKRGTEERIVIANQAARELYSTGDKLIDLSNQTLDRIIPRRLEANRQTDYATGTHRLDYEATLPHGMTRMIRDIVRILDMREDAGEFVHSVSELNRAAATDFPSRKYMPPLLSKTGVELSFLGSSTLLYCDLSPFIKRCDEKELGVSEAVDELKRHLVTITELVLKAGGTVEKFFGERVLIHFGVSRGTDRSAASARNCTRLALQIRSALRGQRAPHEERFPAISCRIGIATSQVLACSLGTEQRSDFTLVGQAVVMAETLAQEADQDEILLSQSTSVLLGDRFELGKSKSTSVLWGDKTLYAYPVERERPESAPEQPPGDPSQSLHQTKFPQRS